MLRRLRVEVCEVVGLSRMGEVAGKPEVFIIVSCGHEHWRTTAKAGLRDHVWNERHSFNPAPFIHIRAMDQTRTGKEDVLGHGRMELGTELLRKLQAEVQSLWVDLMRAGRRVGRVRVLVGAEFERTQPNGVAETNVVTPKAKSHPPATPVPADLPTAGESPHRSRSQPSSNNVAFARKLRQEIEREKAEHQRIQRQHLAELEPLQAELQRAKAELEEVIREVGRLQHNGGDDDKNNQHSNKANKADSRRRQRRHSMHASREDAATLDYWPGHRRLQPNLWNNPYSSRHTHPPAVEVDPMQRGFAPPTHTAPIWASATPMPVPLTAPDAVAWSHEQPHHSLSGYGYGYGYGDNYPPVVRTQRALTLY